MYATSSTSPSSSPTWRQVPEFREYGLLLLYGPGAALAYTMIAPSRAANVSSLPWAMKLSKDSASPPVPLNAMKIGALVADARLLGTKLKYLRRKGPQWLVSWSKVWSVN